MIPVPSGQTLRQLAQQNNWNIDWDRLNSSGNDDGNAYRRQIFDMVNQQYNPYGTMGAAGLDPMGRAGEVDVSIIPDDLSGQWGEMARRLGARDAPELRGMLSRGRGETLFSGDRGMYNEYVADLGNMTYDDALGWVPGEGGWQQGSRVGDSFRNMGMWGPAAVLGVGLLGNMGLFGAAEGAAGASGGSGFASMPPGLEGAPSLTGGGTVATGGSLGATPGFSGNLAGTSGTLTSGAGSAGLGGGLLGGGGGSGTGAFDTGGWSGTGINGATGVRGPLDSFMYNVRGFGMNPVGWAMNNPVDAIRGVSSLYNLGSSVLGGGGTTSRQSSKPAGQQPNQSNLQPQFHTNAITAGQLANLYGGQYVPR